MRNKRRKEDYTINLYKESEEIIHLAQNKDPFFNYLTDYIVLPNIKHNTGRVIDLGCGSGRNTVVLAQRGLEVIGVDIVGKSLHVADRYARQRGVKNKIRLIEKDILNLKKGELGVFNCCILQEVIEHVADYRKVIEVAFDFLVLGGILILTTPNDPRQWNIFDTYAKHIRRFTIDELKSSFNKFSKVQIYTVGFPFHRLVIFLSNQYLKLAGKKYRASDMRKNKLFYYLYFAILSILLRIDHLFRFIPWGTTIVVIAQK